MILNRFEDADPFLHRAQPYLEQQEAVNTMLLNLALEYRSSPDRFPSRPYLALIEDEQGIVLAAGMAPPRKIFLFINRDEGGQAMRLLVSDLMAGGWLVPSVFAPLEMAALFANTWQEMSGMRCHAGLRSRLYELKKVIFPTRAAGRLRLAEMGDLDLVARWMVNFKEEALGSEGQAEARLEAEQRIKKQEIHLWMDGGRPVSMAAKARPTTSGISIRLVFTPPEWRGKGYASTCVAVLSQACLDNGRKFCCLFTDLNNPTTHHIYQKIGYTPVTDFCEWSFPHSPA
jgi:GNAT superfamily N-acetyltransferase